MLALVGLGSWTQAQFVWPKPEYNIAEPGLYVEDPFIVAYRREFFAVFRGDVPRFEKAFAEIVAMVGKDPTDARARVWYGNGLTVKAGIEALRGNERRARWLLRWSNRELDQAVALKPDDPNIYMMRAATLFVQGQYLPKGFADRRTWLRLRDDCLRFIEFLGEDRLSRVSIHVRGEAYGELAIAYKELGDYERARLALLRLKELCPGTSYEERADRELANLPTAALGPKGAS